MNLHNKVSFKEIDNSFCCGCIVHFTEALGEFFNQNMRQIDDFSFPNGLYVFLYGDVQWTLVQIFASRL